MLVEEPKAEAVLRTGITCLSFVLKQLGIPVPTFRPKHEISPQALPHEAPDGTNLPLPADTEGSVDLLVSIAREAGIHVEVEAPTLPDLAGGGGRLGLAALNSGNFVVICGHSVDGSGNLEKLFVFDPLATTSSGLLWVGVEGFRKAWSGTILYIRDRRTSSEFHAEKSQEPHPVTEEFQQDAKSREQPATSGTGTFGFSWFLDYVFQNAKYFRAAVIVSLLLHVLSLAPPIFFQIVVDRVLVHHVYETLIVLTVCVALAVCFNSFFGYARERILLHAANRMDAAIYPETFRHLLKLPLQYFDTRSVGILIKHMQQSDQIREFIAGRLFVTILNATVLIVIIPLLFYYNAILSALTLGISLIFLITIFGLIFPLRRRLLALYVAEGTRQAMLVETLQGVATVKSLAVEDRKEWEWNSTSARTIEARYRVQRLQILVQTMLGFFDQAMIIAIVVVGSIFVINGTMTIGTLIAFQMLASRVTQPLLELIGITHQIQDTALSIRMLGEVMNATPEQRDSGKRIDPPITGAIRFQGVSFAYPGANERALEELSFDIRAGEFVGIVGRSGSGKTTLMRMILGHYRPDHGSVLFDSDNVADMDLVYLRKHISVVLQETFLFSGSVANNIAVTDLAANFHEIEAAARTAGAAEFIERLPHRYDTWLEEGGRNLSGGQRQRLGLARALLVNRPILILDEATSSLDPESEASIRERLPLICRGRTVILISHKLSLLTEADRIFVLEAGRRIQEGRHSDLINMPGLYAQLWRQQSEPYLPQQRGDSR